MPTAAAVFPIKKAESTQCLLRDWSWLVYRNKRLYTDVAVSLNGYLDVTGPDFVSNQLLELDSWRTVRDNFTRDLIATTPEPSTLVLLEPDCWKALEPPSGRRHQS